ncbi:carboxyl transferase domain-containing protein [Herbiconiux sp. P17]|uniref:carboxyl transferase domain-containing protein n=1 Tax=Herbiconiux wuyangfengii TaxID=3342794 RepID=UPI0035B7075D
MPTVSLLLGQGTGGGGLALLPADVTLAAQHAWLSPLPPEGASAILFRDASRAGEMARRQKISASDLMDIGVVDWIIPERPDAAVEQRSFCRRTGEWIAYALATALALPPESRLERRAERYLPSPSGG